MEEKYIQNLKNLLDEDFCKIKKNICEEKVGILFSAGVDSSTISVFAKKHDLKPTLYNFGTEKSKDKDFAFTLAGDLDLPLVYKEITKEDIEVTIPFIKKELIAIDIDDNPMQVSLALGVYFIGQSALKGGIKVMLTGQGSDELFAGYKKYDGISKEELEEKLRDDIKKVASSDIKRDAHMLSLSGINLVAPFMNDKFSTYALGIPMEYKIRDDQNKYILRMLASHSGLPDYIALRPKHAMQYSSGIQKIVDKINKELRRLP